MLGIIIIATLLLLIAVLSVSFFYSVFMGYAVYFSSGEKIIDRIISEIELRDGVTVYELGSGHALFLRKVESHFPNVKKLVGVEYFLYPYLVSVFILGIFGSKAKILKKNMFLADLTDADLIYCFLNVKSMVKLKDKFLRECKPGTQIVSYQFTMPGITPKKAIDVYGDKKDRIYFYQI